jgi:hypothetical protein
MIGAEFVMHSSASFTETPPRTATGSGLCVGNWTKHLGDVIALRSLSLLISGDWRPDECSLHFEGAPIAVLPPSQAGRHGVGVTHQIHSTWLGPILGAAQLVVVPAANGTGKSSFPSVTGGRLHSSPGPALFEARTARCRDQRSRRTLCRVFRGTRRPMRSWCAWTSTSTPTRNGARCPRGPPRTNRPQQSAG